MKIIIINKKFFCFIILIIISLIFLLFLFKLYFKTEDVINTDPYFQGNKEENIISIACNIDWGNEYIGEILKILKEKDIKINFFPTGRWANENKDTLKNIYNDLHEIGNHGFHHLDYDKLDYNSNFKEIKDAHDVITSIIDDEIKYFAPPSGAYNEHTLKAANELNYKTILWSIDTIDWRQDSTGDIIFNRVKEKLHKSGIILMHPTKETIKALPKIINFVENNGYKIVKISELL